MSNWTTVCAVALSCVVVLDVARRHLTKARYRTSYPLPPGPPGLPFIGNVIGIDANAPWVTYAQWAKTYGDLVYTRLLGNEIIVINSESVAKELLEKRSWNYSDRPFMLINEHCGMDFGSAILPYGDRWRLHRRFFHQTFRSEAVHRFVPLQHRKACQFLQRLLETPDQLSEHVFEYTTSVILKSVYDYDVTAGQDELVDIVCKVLDIVVPVMRPDIAVIVGAFPALLKLPSWFPGMSFKNKMATAREYAKKYVERPFAHSKQQILSGNSSPSMVWDALRKIEEKNVSADEAWVEELKGSSATAFLAASETSNSFLMTFFLLMMMYPEAQKKIQEQIDAVVGPEGRLPTIEDRPSLPYVDAALRETFRYNPMFPLAVPHAAVDDDIYNGFHIPKGALLLPNLWAMGHDESKYPNPHEFVFERFLNEDGTLKPHTTEHLAYGFGRRICVGRHFADTSVWSVVAKFLAVYTISKPLDENGVEIPVEPKFSSGLVIHPLPFRFRIVPRNSEMDAKKLEERIGASIA